MLGSRKTGIGEGSDRDGDQAGEGFGVPKDRRAAVRAELKRHRSSALRRADEFCRLARTLSNLAALEPSLDAENTSAAALAFEAIANRNADGFACADDVQLSATTGGVAGPHCISVPRQDL